MNHVNPFKDLTQTFNIYAPLVSCDQLESYYYYLFWK